MKAPRADVKRIGVLDSGVGGLSVLREIHSLLPNYPTLYFADQAHIPYGTRPPDEIAGFVERIAEFLIERGARVIVLACNAASAASLLDLRARHPAIPFVGMEPAVKPAVEATRTGAIGVLTTRATANGELYRRVLNRYADGVCVITQVAPELVTMVEAGTQDDEASTAVLRLAVQPMLDAGADQIVLACTHFPFLKDRLAAIAGVNLIDPSAAVARQVARVLPSDLAPSDAENLYFTSGSPVTFHAILRRLTGVDADVQAVSALS